MAAALAAGETPSPDLVASAGKTEGLELRYSLPCLAIVLLCLALPTRFVMSYHAQEWLLLLYLGSIPTALAYSLFMVGIRSTSATITSIVTLCEPLTSALLAWIFFGERLGALGLVGALLLLSALLLLASREGSMKAAPTRRFPDPL